MVATWIPAVVLQRATAIRAARGGRDPRRRRRRASGAAGGVGRVEQDRVRRLNADATRFGMKSRSPTQPPRR